MGMLSFICNYYINVNKLKIYRQNADFLIKLWKFRKVCGRIYVDAVRHLTLFIFLFNIGGSINGKQMGLYVQRRRHDHA